MQYYLNFSFDINIFKMLSIAGLICHPE